MKIRYTWGALIASSVVVLSACSGADSGGGSGGDDSSGGSGGSEYAYNSDQDDIPTVEGVALADEMGDVSTDGGYRIAVVLKALTNQYWQGIEAGVEAAAEDFGVEITLQAASSESAQTEQLTIAQTMVSQEYDAYILAPESTSNLSPAVDQIRSQGAPIVNVDDARIPATVYVGPDHKLDGQGAAEFLAENLPEGAQVAQVEGQAGSSAAVLRIEGFEEGAQEAGLDLVSSVPGDWDADKAYAAAQQILSQNPEVGGIYANNDTMAVGVAQAVIDAGRAGEVLVVGTDGVPEALAGIREGTMAATLSPLPYYEGYWAVEAAVRLLEGQDVPAWVVAPAQLITEENADEFYDEEGLVRTDLYQ